MVFGFLKSRGKVETPPPSVPPGIRAYAIGDVHGCVAEYDALMARILEDDAARGPAKSVLVLLGDLVDRGPDSAGAIRRAMALPDRFAETRVIAGNHEEVFLEALTGETESLRFFTRIGGRETILSYGIDPDEYERSNYTQIGKLLAQAVPEEHVAFLGDLEDMVEIGDYLFVHAGIKPGVAFEDQTTNDLRWIRAPFLTSERDHGKIVIHGHNISETPDEQPNRIGIDTGAYRTGKLTAIGLEGEQRWFLSTGDPLD